MNKKYISFVLFFLLFYYTKSSFAQTNIFPGSGNVGVGTVSPISSNSYAIVDLVGGSLTHGGYISFATSDRSKMARIFNTHNAFIFDLQKPGMYVQWRNSENQLMHRLNPDGSATWNASNGSYTQIASNSSGQYIRQYGTDATHVSWLIRGYTLDGIQANFNDGGITVNGTIKTKEVNVTLNGWADYVFKDDYPLLPLADVQSYIQKYNHLPNIPSESEVLKDGVNLGEMNVKLLEKIEELTLYTIQQDELLKQVVLRLAELESKLQDQVDNGVSPTKK